MEREISASIRKKKIHHAAREENWLELKRIFHDIKGIGSSMGYPLLTDLAKKMEQHLAQGEYRVMNESRVHFDAMCDRIHAGMKKVEHL